MPTKQEQLDECEVFNPESVIPLGVQKAIRKSIHKNLESIALCYEPSNNSCLMEWE